MIRLIVVWVFVFGLEVAAKESLEATSFESVKASIGQGKPYFLEVGSKSCHSCQIMDKMLFRIKQQHPQYQIHFIDVKKERYAAYELKVRMIPTQIIYDKEGNEVYRHIGALDSQTLGSLFRRYRF